MKKPGPLRAEKRRLLVVRDAALDPKRRARAGDDLASAARKVFMAGMAARGFSRAEALARWRRSAQEG